MHEDLVQTHGYKSKNKLFVNDKDILRVFSLGVARRLKIVEDSIILTYITQTPNPPYSSWCGLHAHTRIQLWFKRCHFKKQRQMWKFERDKLPRYVRLPLGWFHQRLRHRKLPFWPKSKNKNSQRGGRHLRFFGFNFHFMFFCSLKIAWIG